MEWRVYYYTGGACCCLILALLVIVGVVYLATRRTEIVDDEEDGGDAASPQADGADQAKADDTEESVPEGTYAHAATVMFSEEQHKKIMEVAASIKAEAAAEE